MEWELFIFNLRMWGKEKMEYNYNFKHFQNTAVKSSGCIVLVNTNMKIFVAGFERLMQNFAWSVNSCVLMLKYRVWQKIPSFQLKSIGGETGLILSPRNPADKDGGKKSLWPIHLYSFLATPSSDRSEKSPDRQVG